MSTTLLASSTILPYYFAAGDEPFLRRQAVLSMRRRFDCEDAVNIHGDDATWADVMSDYRSLSLFAPRRLVVVEDADKFVSGNRQSLERFVKDSRPDDPNVLLLSVSAWPANTKLAKLTPAAHVINCKALPLSALPSWCVKHCPAAHGKRIAPDAAALLADLVGAEMSLLDCEMAKLSASTTADTVTRADVDSLVGRLRDENAWELVDLIGTGNVAGALSLLDRLLEQEEPYALLAKFIGPAVRRAARAARLLSQGVPMGAALDRAGTPPWPRARQGDERLIRHLGPVRAGKLLDWLADVDAGMKGGCTLAEADSGGNAGCALPKTVQLERLIVRLATRAVKN